MELSRGGEVGALGICLCVQEKRKGQRAWITEECGHGQYYYVDCLLIKLMITRAAQKPKMATIILQKIAEKCPSDCLFHLRFAPACLMRIKRPGNGDQTVNQIATRYTLHMRLL